MENFPDLVVAGSLSAPPVAGNGGIIDVPGTTVQNIGTAAAVTDTDFDWRYLLSADSTLDVWADTSLGTIGNASTLGPGGAIPFPAQQL